MKQQMFSTHISYKLGNQFSFYSSKSPYIQFQSKISDYSKLDRFQYKLQQILQINEVAFITYRFIVLSSYMESACPSAEKAVKASQKSTLPIMVPNSLNLFT